MAKANQETPAVTESPTPTDEGTQLVDVNGQVEAAEIITEPIPTPTTADEVVAAVEAGIDLVTGLPVNQPEVAVEVPRSQSEAVGLADASFDESVAALRTASAPGAPLVANPSPVPNEAVAAPKGSTTATVIDGAQPIIAMPVEDYKRKVSTAEARRAQTLNLDNRGGAFGIRSQKTGEIVGWVDGNGVQVEAPSDFQDDGVI